MTKKRTPKYQKIEKEELHLIKEKPSTICPSCGDISEIGNMKGEFNCAACGWLIVIKDNMK